MVARAIRPVNLSLESLPHISLLPADPCKVTATSTSNLSILAIVVQSQDFELHSAESSHKEAMASQKDVQDLLRLLTTGRNKLPMMAAMGRVKALQAANLRR